MERHIKILSILHVAYGVLLIMLGTIGFLLYLLFGRSYGSIQVFPFIHLGHFTDFGILRFLVPLWFFMTIVTVLTTLAGIIGGVGLYFRQNWARVLLIIVGVLVLLRFPLGTALGIYTLWVLAKPETAKLTTT
jgi:hypothetical protein